MCELSGTAELESVCVCMCVCVWGGGGGGGYSSPKNTEAQSCNILRTS